MRLFKNQNRMSETVDGIEVPMNQLLDYSETKMSHKQAERILLLYFVIYTLLTPVVIFVLIQLMEPLHLPLITIQIGLQVFFGILILILCLYSAKDLMKESFYAIYKQKKYMVFIAVSLTLPMIYSHGFISTLIRTFTGTSSSNNQIAVESLLKAHPIYGIFFVTIFASIVEELVFRGVFFRKLRTKHGFWIATAVSCFLFGFLHVVMSLSTGDFIDLLNIFVYGIMSFYLCLSYELTGSIYTPILLHFINNALSILVLFLGAS